MKNKQDTVFVVVRYHNISEVFASELDAEEFAQQCGDYEDFQEKSKKDLTESERDGIIYS